jgi:hypothetical protein
MVQPPSLCMLQVFHGCWRKHLYVEIRGLIRIAACFFSILLFYKFSVLLIRATQDELSAKQALRPTQLFKFFKLDIKTEVIKECTSESEITYHCAVDRYSFHRSTWV